MHTNMSLREGDFNMNDIAALTARIEKLERELATLQDIHRIRRLQYTYGYFIDKSQYNEVVDLKAADRSEEHTSELQSPDHLVCRLLLEKKKKTKNIRTVN